LAQNSHRQIVSLLGTIQLERIAMRTFPPFAAFIHALKSVLRYWRIGLMIALPWIALGVLATSMTSLMNIELRQQNAALLIALQMALAICALASIAVSWHRFVLLDETPPLVFALRFDAPVWSYIRRILLMLLAATGLSLLIALPLSMIVPPQLMQALIAPFAYALIIVLSMSLPAAALQKPSIPFLETFKAVRGNELNVVGFAILALASAVALVITTNAAASVSSALFPAPFANIIAAIVAAPLNAFGLLLNTSIITAAYGFFFEKRDF
jgi:hypothetical protein